MANRYDIIRIDFQASAKGANSAIESIRKEAEDCNTKISELKKNIAEAPKNGTDAKILAGWNDELKVTEKRFKQFNTAYKELVKGMRALDEGVKMFNDGSLQEMNAAFQKTVNNAAKLAQSKLKAGTDEWRQMGAIMQETEQNYSRMQRDTDQLIESLQNGGTVFRKTLDDEKKGLQDLLQVLPYMGTEYRKAQEQLDFLVKKTDEMIVKERQMKGEIVTTDDARRVSLQLTKDGAEAAKQRAAAADEEIEKAKQMISKLEEEQKSREANARASAQAAADYRENQRMREDEIERLDKEIKKEDELANSKKNGLDALRKKAEIMKADAEDEKKTQQELDGVYDAAKEKAAKLREEVEKLRHVATSAPVKDSVAETVKTSAEGASVAVKKETDETKKKTEAKKEEVNAGEKAVETQKKEKVTVDSLLKSIQEQEAALKKLREERDKLSASQKQGAQATKEEANAFKDLTKEQAQAMLEQKQALATFKNEGGQMKVTNREEGQQFLFDSLKSISGKLGIEGSPQKVNELLSQFKSRYGLQSDDDAMNAIRSLMSGGGLIKSGFMNKQFLTLEQDTANISAFKKEVEQLTAVINGESKAVEENIEQKRALAEIEAEIESKEKEQRESVKLLRRLREGGADVIEKEVQKNEKLAASHNQNTEAIKKEIEAIRQMNREQAEAMKNEMMAKSSIGWKAGKLDASNLEEVQHYLLTQISKKGVVGKDGTYTLAGQNIDSLLTAFQNKYGLSGQKNESKAILKELIQGKNGGLFQEGGIVDFNAETLLVKANTEAYQGRLEKLKALIAITNGTAQATEKSTEATRKDTEATKSQTDAIKEQEAEVARRKAAFDKASADYDAKKAKLTDMKSAMGRLPKSGTDALFARQQAKDEIDDYNENVVKPARADKTKLKGLWEKSVKDLVKMQGQDTEETKKNTEAESKNAEATEKAAKGKRSKQKASEDAAKAVAEETRKSDELIAKEKELKDAETAEATAKKNAEEQQEKTTKAINDAEAATAKADEAEKKHVETMKNLKKERQENADGLKKLNEANKDTIAINDKNQKLLEETNGKIREQGEKIRDAERIKAQANTEGIEKTEQAIRLLSEENRRIDQNSDKWVENTKTIQHLQQALDEMKNKPALMMMTDRMQDVSKLSSAAVTETKRFWETMVAGAEKGSKNLAEYEAHLKTITDEEQKRTKAQLQKDADILKTSDLSVISEQELQTSIRSAKQLAQAMDPADQAYKELVADIIRAEEHVNKFGLAGETSTQKAELKLQQMTDRMGNLGNLSTSALAETKKFWETMVSETERGDAMLATYEARLKEVKNQEQARSQIANSQKAGIVRSESFNAYSLDEIRESIAAAKELHSHMASASPDAMRLAESIAKAEEHVKKYGGEAARTAQANETMRQQFATMVNDMNRGIMPSASAVKAQQSYWKRLIDDPKTAKESLQEYRDQLAEVEKMQEAMVKISGETAYQWFQNGSYKDASTNKVKDMADDLKAYRDSLPQETEAAKIKQIDQWLQKAGQSAKKASEELMDFDKAKEIAMQAGDDIYGKKGPAFMVSPEEIQAATKSIEKYREELFKTIKAKRDSGEATDVEEQELKELAKYLKDLKFEQDNFNMSREKMEALMKTPVSASNLDELRAAIKRADAELRRMEGSLDENSDKYKELAADVKNAKVILKEMEGQAKATTSAFDKAWSRLKTYVGLYVGASVAMNKLMGTMGDLMDLSDKMGEVRKTTGFTADEVGRLSDNLKKFDTRTALTGLMDLSVAAGQLGLKTEEDVMGFTEAANKLMVALPEMGREGATEMLKVALATGEIDKIRKQMEDGLIEGSSATAVAMEKVGSTIDRLRATSAATAPAITDFVKRVGAVGAQSGITIDQVAALGSTVDALGMRVEMSATALSRMIPAIKNNAYQIGSMIGQTEESIIKRFENGMGMDVILDIFQSIRDNSKMMTGNMEADAEAIEQAFEGAGLKEVMKELNQQGARAGIVFAGLSQNVGELRRQLGVAAEAYEENIAIQMEYDKMNDTTAAKWERLKNQMEEFFVGDAAQRGLGWIIDGLRKIVDLLTGDDSVSIALRTVLVYLTLVRLKLVDLAAGALRALWTGITNIGVALGVVEGKMKAMQIGNVFTALAGAALYAAYALGAFTKKVSQADLEMAKAEKAIADATEKLDRMFDRLDKQTTAAERATEATQHLAEGSEDLAAAEDKATIATAERKKTIDTINGLYGQYLGYMLTEYDRAELIAAAHDKITASIKREMYEKQKQQAMEKLEGEYNPKILDEWASLRTQMREMGVDGQVISETFEQMQTIMETTRFNPNTGAMMIQSETWNELSKTLGEEAVKAARGLDELMAQYMYKHLAELTNLTVEQLTDLTGVVGLKSTERGKVESRGAESGFVTRGEGGGGNVRQGLASVYQDFLKKRDDIADIFANSIGKWAKEEHDRSVALVNELKASADKSINTITTSSDNTEIDNAYMQLADALVRLDREMQHLDQNVDSAIISNIKALADKANRQTDSSLLSQARQKAQSLIVRATTKVDDAGGGGGGGGGRGPYGNYDKRVAPYEEWDANALVKRREDMLMRVRALANGADVQAVLSMDKRFMDEATRKGIKDMRDAIEWYNTERMKIQEELHERHLTNEGQWMDPKKSRSRKPKQVYSEEAIAELDRYYAWRKEELERQRAEEGVSEAEFNRRMETMEQEHLQKRSDLRKSFTTEDKHFVKQFRDWWKSVAELDTIEWELIEAEWTAALDRDRKYNNRDAQKDLAAMRAIVVKQLAAIEDIIDKERPFNGITRNLQENLTKMGILFADLDKMRKEALEKGESTADIDAKYVAEEPKRLAWLLGQAEDAYTLTVEEMMRRMADAGMTAWADELTNGENADKQQRALLAQLHTMYDDIQAAIKKESSQIKKETDIWWNDIMPGQEQSRKGGFERMLSMLGLQEGQVKRANQLIGAGVASERVADRLAIKQMQIRLAMQETYYNRMRQIGQQRIADLQAAAKLARERGDIEEAQRKEQDAEHLARSLNLSLSEEQKKLDEQRVSIQNQLEESQNRLYTSMKEWGSLLASSVQSIFEASHAGDAEYYNSLALYNLTGKGGPGAGTYVVTENAGKEGATAHYEYLSEIEAIERQREIERQNAMADAWKKVWDDLNNKMSEQITDWMNAALQNQSIDANTSATLQNTEALAGLTSAIAGGSNGIAAYGTRGASGTGGTGGTVVQNKALSSAEIQEWTDALSTEPWQVWEEAGVSAAQKVQKTTEDADKKMQTSAQSTFAKMTAAANLYGIAYQTMSNDNLSSMQKFEMFALQAAGNAAISMLTTDLAAGQAKNTVQLPGILGKLIGEMPYPAAIATFAAITALMGGLMGLAVSKVTKSKAQIAQATGASSANAGKLTTGMLTYAEGNVNEFTDPSSLTVGRQYNVDGADGKTYRARYMGKGAKTHITNGPEFHLVGEAGREAIIDAHTTRNIQMNEPEIWRTIQALYNGGRVTNNRIGRGRGMAAFADGNIDDFGMGGDGISLNGTGGIDIAAMTEAMNRQTAVQEALLERLNQPIVAQNIWHGPEGIPNMYNKMEKEAKRHGVKYL